MDESGYGAGPFFQRSMANKVLAGYVTRICEIYIDDLPVHGRTDDELLDNLRKILVRLHTNRVTANPKKTELGLDEVEYVGHLISSDGSWEASTSPRVSSPHYSKGTSTVYWSRELFSQSCTTDDWDGQTFARVS